MKSTKILRKEKNITIESNAHDITIDGITLGQMFTEVAAIREELDSMKATVLKKLYDLQKQSDRTDKVLDSFIEDIQNVFGGE